MIDAVRDLYELCENFRHVNLSRSKTALTLRFVSESDTHVRAYHYLAMLAESFGLSTVTVVDLSDPATPNGTVTHYPVSVIRRNAGTLAGASVTYMHEFSFSESQRLFMDARTKGIAVCRCGVSQDRHGDRDGLYQLWGEVACGGLGFGDTAHIIYEYIDKRLLAPHADSSPSSDAAGERAILHGERNPYVLLSAHGNTYRFSARSSPARLKTVIGHFVKEEHALPVRLNDDYRFLTLEATHGGTTVRLLDTACGPRESAYYALPAKAFGTSDSIRFHGHLIELSPRFTTRRLVGEAYRPVRGAFVTGGVRHETGADGSVRFSAGVPERPHVPEPRQTELCSHTDIPHTHLKDAPRALPARPDGIALAIEPWGWELEILCAARETLRHASHTPELGLVVENLPQEQREDAMGTRVTCTLEPGSVHDSVLVRCLSKTARRNTSLMRAMYTKWLEKGLRVPDGETPVTVTISSEGRVTGVRVGRQAFEQFVTTCARKWRFDGCSLKGQVNAVFRIRFSHGS